jgi:hypothetical protein
VGGDLRVPHFVGLRALQILPLLGGLLTRRRGVRGLLDANDRLVLVWTSGLAYPAWSYINDVTRAGQRATVRFGMIAAGDLFREFARQMPRPMRAFFTLVAR